MNFKNFSLFITDTKVGKFVDHLTQGEIQTTQCEKCETRYYPPRADCPKCMTSNMKWVRIADRGKLITYTSIFTPPKHFAESFDNKSPFSNYAYKPCPVGIVELDAGLRVMGWIPEIESQDLQVGMLLDIEPQTLPDESVTIVLKSSQSA